MLNRWSQPNGYKEVLRIGLPMIISMGSVSVMQFTDNLFLANYSLDAIAAVTPAGFASFLFLCFFSATAFYVNVFVAQYYGSGDNSRIGASLWQGIYFALISSIFLIGLSFLGETIFTLSKHPSDLIGYESTYFQIRTAGGGFRVLATVLSCFYSGLGRTRTIMIINLISCGLNIPLDYILIYGIWFVPELGIAGAAIATITSSMFGVILYVFLIFNKQNNRIYSVISACRFDRKLFTRVIRYGTPSGVNLFFDLLAVTIFFLIIGRLGKDQLAAANIAMAVDMLIFIPIFGLSVAASTLVGKAIGKGKPDEAVTATKSIMHLTVFYAVTIGLSIIIFSEQLAYIFRPQEMSIIEYSQILSMVTILLIFMAIFNFGDSVSIMLAAILKGAGDSSFPMYAMAVIAIFVLIIPVYIEINYLDAGIYVAFASLSSYLVTYALVLYIRYKRGKWKSMKVIEKTALDKINAKV